MILRSFSWVHYSGYFLPLSLPNLVYPLFVCIIFQHAVYLPMDRLICGQTLLNGKNFIQLNLIAFSYQSYFVLACYQQPVNHLNISVTGSGSLSRLTSWCHKHKGILTSSTSNFCVLFFLFFLFVHHGQCSFLFCFMILCGLWIVDCVFCINIIVHSQRLLCLNVSFHIVETTFVMANDANAVNI